MLENYLVLLTESEYKDLIHCFTNNKLTAYRNLVEFKTKIQRGSYALDLSKPEMCVLLNVLEINGFMRIRNMIRNQLSNQDTDFFRYYEALKRDLSRIY